MNSESLTPADRRTLARDLLISLGRGRGDEKASRGDRTGLQPAAPQRMNLNLTAADAFGIRFTEDQDQQVKGVSWVYKRAKRHVYGSKQIRCKYASALSLSLRLE